jgi:CBS domain-containing protein
MEVPPKIQYAAQRLRKGHRVHRLTVRDFLRHFEAERRGAVKVAAIRAILDSLDIQTEPNFETAWIDEPMWLRLKGDTPAIDAAPMDRLSDEEFILDSTPSAIEQVLEQSESAPTSAEPDTPEGPTDFATSDPTFRIGLLPAANKTLVTVNQDDEIARAVTLMLQYDFSQLPVMQGDREVKGVVTWKSIGSRKALDAKCERARDCQEEVRIVDANRTLFDSIPIIVDHGYVLVRQRDRKVSGIVTASDLSLQFQVLAEPFLLLREIELHVRQILKGKVNPEDFSLFDSVPPPGRQPQDIADLTFGDYVRLFEHPQIWGKLNLKIDRVVLTKLLEDVRTVRNEVMHFDPDPMTSDELAILKRAVHLMREVYVLVP